MCAEIPFRYAVKAVAWSPPRYAASAFTNWSSAYVMFGTFALSSKMYRPEFGVGRVVSVQPKKFFGAVVVSLTPPVGLFGSRPRYTPFGAGESIRVRRGSTTPPKSVPFMRFTAKIVCRYDEKLLRLCPRKL